MTVSVCPEKYARVCKEIDEFMQGRTVGTDSSGREVVTTYDGKQLERLRGKIISWLLVCPHLGLYTTEMDKMISWLNERSTYVIPASQLKVFEIEKELRRWQTLKGVEKTRKLYKPSHEVMVLPVKELYTDASGTLINLNTQNYVIHLGFAGGSYFIEETANGPIKHESIYTWTDEFAGEEINFKELAMLALAIERYGPHFATSRLLLLCDNSATCSIWAKRKSPVLKYNRLDLTYQF